jgi:hypothetical protein
MLPSIAVAPKGMLAEKINVTTRAISSPTSAELRTLDAGVVGLEGAIPITFAVKVSEAGRWRPLVMLARYETYFTCEFSPQRANMGRRMDGCVRRGGQEPRCKRKMRERFERETGRRTDTFLPFR